MKALLVLSAYLSPLVSRTNFANGMSVFLVFAVWFPFLGTVVLLISWWHLPLHPLCWLAVAGLAFWFGAYAKRFAQAHRAEILARSRTRPWPKTRAAALFVFSFLLFAGLLKIAAWMNG